MRYKATEPSDKVILHLPIELTEYQVSVIKVLAERSELGLNTYLERRIRKNLQTLVVKEGNRKPYANQKVRETPEGVRQRHCNHCDKWLDMRDEVWGKGAGEKSPGWCKLCRQAEYKKRALEKHGARLEKPKPEIIIRERPE